MSLHLLIREAPPTIQQVVPTIQTVAKTIQQVVPTIQQVVPTIQTVAKTMQQVVLAAEVVALAKNQDIRSKLLWGRNWVVDNTAVFQLERCIISRWCWASQVQGCGYWRKDHHFPVHLVKPNLLSLLLGRSILR